MNTDEMEAGRELDALVAEKVMGWKLINYYTDEPVTSDTDYKEASYNDGWTWEGRPGSKEAWEWQPSKDIAVAWEVVEKLAEYCIIRVSNGDGDSRDCDIIPFALDKIDEYNDAHISAETWPLAICRAALRVVNEY